MAGARLQDVAERVGVSLATASLALSGKGRISVEVREKIFAAADTLGYRARSAQRVRPTAAQCPVGIVYPDDRSHEWFFTRPILIEIELAMLREGFAPVMVPVSALAGRGQTLHIVETCGLCAVFSVQFGEESLFEDLERRGTYLVVVNNSNFQDRHYSVCVDDFQGAYEGAQHLVSLGHRVIAFVEYERPDMPVLIADRFVGFRKALDENALPFSADHRVTIPFIDSKRLVERLESLFSRSDRPTAIFAHDDYLGLYVIMALRELGLRVPDDVSLIAPGDVLDYSLPGQPQITTMRINSSLLGRIAGSLMLERFRHAHEDVHVLKVKEQLVKRASCRSIAGGR
ncbi:MAG TPA: LacI family DNA-binding transcriptional regulator [Spirochaetia bacterium]|nr:LacI family DNA-binding transcriptional regulator [Spirochaetia bacterium]